MAARTASRGGRRVCDDPVGRIVARELEEPALVSDVHCHGARLDGAARAAQCHRGGCRYAQRGHIGQCGCRPAGHDGGGIAAADRALVACEAQ